jgi:hypothetical protein
VKLKEVFLPHLFYHVSGLLLKIFSIWLAHALERVPNCPGADLSWYRNVSHRCRSVLVPICPGAEVFRIPIDLGKSDIVPKSLINY